MEIRQNVDGSSVLSGSPDELAEYILKLSADDPEPEEGQAYVGQLIRKGTKFREIPKGIKVLDDGSSESLRYRHVSEDGDRACWADTRRTPAEVEFYRSSPHTTTWADMIVREVW